METDQGVEREEILFLPPNSTFEDHLCQLQVVLRRLRRAGLNVNTEKSSFFAFQRPLEISRKSWPRKLSSLTQISMKYLKFAQMPVIDNWVQLSLRMGNP